MNKLTVVSGCPRSGTSLMMDLLRLTFGEDQIIGKKWPGEPPPFQQMEDEPDASWQLRQYREGKSSEHAKQVDRFNRSKDLNPAGFWEEANPPWTVRGLPFTPRATEQIEAVRKDKSIIKIVSQGLAASDPQHIGKIIFMLRHPRAVAKSQERLEGQFSPLDRPVRNGRDVGKHTPKMFVQVTKAAAYWLNVTGADYLLVNFEDLIEAPKKTLDRVQAFLGKGDFTAAISAIDPKLRRSYPQDIENPLWDCAEEIHTKMAAGDLQGVIDAEVPKQADNEKSYHCFRLQRRVVENECHLCRTDLNTRRNYKNTAKGLLKYNWEQEPCAWEVVNEGKTPAESIANNSWRNQTVLNELNRHITFSSSEDLLSGSQESL